jgi:hypothetical protein
MQAVCGGDSTTVSSITVISASAVGSINFVNWWNSFTSTPEVQHPEYADKIDLIEDDLTVMHQLIEHLKELAGAVSTMVAGAGPLNIWEREATIAQQFNPNDTAMTKIKDSGKTYWFSGDQKTVYVDADGNSQPEYVYRFNDLNKIDVYDGATWREISPGLRGPQ